MRALPFAYKIFDWDSIVKTADAWKDMGYEIVFTNGCFDLLHLGHIAYLAEARSLGDKLIVGLNSGASVTNLKGARRPINDEFTRQAVMAALECVDAVVLFPQDTPYELICRIKPDILVKGGDWKTEQIVGADIVLALGGKVLSLPFIQGYSTSAIELKIRNAG